MVAAGEESGARAAAFDRLAGFLERDRTLRKRLQSALFYPALVVAVALVVTAYLLVVVLPQFAQLFSQFGTAPSGSMRALLALSRYAVDPFALTAAGIASATAALGGALLSSRPGALAFDRLRLRVPVLGEALRRARGPNRARARDPSSVRNRVSFARSRSQHR